MRGSIPPHPRLVLRYSGSALALALCALGYAPKRGEQAPPVLLGADGALER